jgi:Ca2+-binding EF-hand superfamily protein
MRKTIVFLAATAALAGAFAIVATAREPGIPSSKKVFNRLDKNNDGRLGLDELKPKSERRFMRLDTDKDGTVTSAEIDTWLQEIAERRKQRILDQMDGDGDGAVTQAEAASYIDGMFAAADANADGGVTIDEARAYHVSKRKKNADAPNAEAEQD